MIGKCFNCLAGDHVHAKCTFPSRCFNCKEEGHQERDCPRPSAPGRWGEAGTLPRRPHAWASGALGGVTRRLLKDLRQTWTPHGLSPPTVPPVCDPQSAEIVAESVPEVEPVVEPVGAGRSVATGTGMHVNILATGGFGAVDANIQQQARSRGYPRSLLRRAVESPASPRTRARTPLLGLVVIPRTLAL